MEPTVIRASILAWAGALMASPAEAIYKCESPGLAPVYQDAPCPTGAAVKTIEPDKERADRLRKEAADRDEQVRRDKKAKQEAEAKRRETAMRAEFDAGVARDRAEGYANPKGIAEGRCASGIAEKMPGLEVTGDFVHLGNGLLPDERRVRVAVRLADSFRAAPVGVVECDVNVVTRDVRVIKLPM